MGENKKERRGEVIRRKKRKGYTVKSRDRRKR